MGTLTSDPIHFDYLKGHGSTFTVDIPACTAGQTVAIYIGGGAIPASINLTDSAGTPFERKTPDYTAGDFDNSIWDVTAVGGETAVFVDLGSGDGNESGTIYPLAPGLTFVGGSHNGSGADTPGLAGDFQLRPDAVTLADAKGLLIAGFTAESSAPYGPGNRWRSLGPYGRIYGEGGNQPGNGGGDLVWMSGLMDVDNTHSFPEQGAAGTYQATSIWLGAGHTFCASALYSDTSGVLTNPPVNRIVQENSLPGTHEGNWYLTTATDATICGFTDKPSYQPGDEVQFFVDSSDADFRLEIYRTGYYNYEAFSAKNQTGAQGGYITGTPTVQPTPNVDATTGATDCTNWTSNASWTIPEDACSGQYYVLARRTDDTTKVSVIQFIVSGDVTNKVAVCLPDFTREAYNPWGAAGDHGIRGTGVWSGKNLYQDGGDGAAANILHRSYAVNRFRPNGILDSQSSTSYTDTELGTVAFMEAQGYDLVYVSNWDLDADPTILTRARTVVILGHHEYLSTNALQALQNARDAGKNIMSQGANNAGWRVRFDSSDTARNTIICYKESETEDQGPNVDLPGDGFDPGDTDGSPQWTGTWRDARTLSNGKSNPDVRPDNALFGQYFIASGPVQLSVTVPAASKDKPIWRNSPDIQALATGGTYTTPVHTLGFEVDYPSGDMSQPLNLVNLNPYPGSFPDGTDAAGSTYDTPTGDITCGFTLYLAQSRALVFHTGVWRGWWGISRWQGGAFSGNVVDVNWQNAFLSVMHDLGEVPTTLTAMQPDVDTALTDPATGSPGSGVTPVARAYGLKVPVSTAALLLFLT